MRKLILMCLFLSSLLSSILSPANAWAQNDRPNQTEQNRKAHLTPTKLKFARKTGWTIDHNGRIIRVVIQSTSRFNPQQRQIIEEFKWDAVVVVEENR
ncbi:MAG: hypothetical protein NZM04_09535 [Methylacidiphilales bacterium]|nr:hypothetical protein [Candidatus Methylacidiphilales bacterium]